MRVWFFAAARFSYHSRFFGENFAIFRLTSAWSLLEGVFGAAFCFLSLVVLVFFAFLASLGSTSSWRLRLVFLSVILTDLVGASDSESEVGGVLAPEGGIEASVALAELSSIVPAIASPFTKKP